MKSLSRLLIANLFITLLWCAPLYAAAPAWDTDNAHSRFGFEIRHIFSSVYGFFDDYTAKLAFDPDNPETGSMHFVIKTKSVQTYITQRDDHLRSPDFFDAETYPEITFTSSGITANKEGNLEVHGTLTIKDVSEQVILPFRFLGITDHPMEKEKQVAGFEMRMPLDRLHYHVGSGKFFQMGVVGREVMVVVSIEATRDR